MRGGKNFINENTAKSLVSMVIPLMVTLCLNMAYSLTDSLWIGNMLGENAMAALTCSTAVILLYTCLIVGSTNGMAILLSQALGAGDKKKEGAVKMTSFLLFLVGMLVVVILSEVYIEPILHMMKTPEETFYLAKDYLSVYLIGVLPSFFYMYFATILRCYGNTMFQMNAILVSVILNIFLDPILIGMVGFHGAAVATIITQCISLIAAVVYVIKKRCFQPKLRDFSWESGILILKKALPSIVQQSIPAISTMALTMLVTSFGISAIAAFGIIGKMECVLIYPVMAMNMGLTIIAGQCVGAKRLDRMGDYVKENMRLGGASILLLTILMVVFARPFAGLFLKSRPVIEIVGGYFLIAGAGYVIHAVTTSFLAGLNGMGKTTAAMLLYIFYFLCVRIPLAIVLSKKTTMGINGIWAAVMISHVVAILSAILIYYCEKKKLTAKMNMEQKVKTNKESE